MSCILTKSETQLQQDKPFMAYTYTATHCHHPAEAGMLRKLTAAQDSQDLLTRMIKLSVSELGLRVLCQCL